MTGCTPVALDHHTRFPHLSPKRPSRALNISCGQRKQRVRARLLPSGAVTGSTLQAAEREAPNAGSALLQETKSSSLAFLSAGNAASARILTPTTA